MIAPVGVTPPSMLTRELKTCSLPVMTIVNGQPLEVGQCMKPVGHKDRCRAGRFSVTR